jgi:hypothetical protein
MEGGFPKSSELSLSNPEPGSKRAANERAVGKEESNDSLQRLSEFSLQQSHRSRAASKLCRPHPCDEF